MRKTNILPIIAMTLAVLASFAMNPTGKAFAQASPPVGVVIAYTPGESITILDESGKQHEYMISSTLKIDPATATNSIVVGSFVTIIAPASLSEGKEMAVGIVVHPKIPAGWKTLALSATPAVKDTVKETYTPTPVGTLPATEKVEVPVTGTTTATTPETVTGKSVEKLIETPTPIAKTAGGDKTVNTSAFMDWLRSLLQQLLGTS